MTTDYEPFTEKNPEQLSSSFLPFSSTDIQFAAAMGTLVFVTNTFYGRLYSALVLLLLVVGLYRSDNARIYFAFGQWWHSLWIRRIRHGVIFNSQRPTQPIRMNLTVIDSTALIHNKSRNTDSVVITGSGSPLVAQNIAQQYDSHQLLAAINKRVAATRGYSVGVSYVFRRRPPNTTKLWEMLAENLHPDVAFPELDIDPALLTNAQKRDLALYQNMVEMVDVMGMEAGEVEMAAVFSIKRERDITSALKRGVESRRLHRMPINKVTDAALTGLRQFGVTDANVLDLNGVQAYLRESWDVAGLEQYYERASRGETSGLESSEHWPSKSIIVGHDFVYADGTYHSVMRITRCPQRVIPSFFRQLHAADTPWLSIALVGETVKSGTEYEILNRLIPLRERFQDIVGVDYKGPKVQARDDSFRERQEDIYQSRFGQDYGIYIAVSALDHDERQDAIHEVMKTVVNLGMSAALITGECRQLPALQAATTGVNTL